MTVIDQRYASAINSRSLKVDGRTQMSDSDVLGGMGLADKRLTEGWVTTGPNGEGYSVKRYPLAVPLERLFAGDARAAHEIVQILAWMVWSKADSEKVKPKLPRADSLDMARACLAWHRDGTCKACGGHGFKLIPNTKTIGASRCLACKATGKLPFERQFPAPWRDLARWLVSEIENHSGQAGPAAMKAIADRMSL
jgi:hypothetical protein